MLLNLLLHYTEWLGEAMPDTSTEVVIASQTLGSASATITFSGIPATYTDLRLVVIGADNDSAGYNIRFQFNNDTGNNYSFTDLRGDGSSASSLRVTNDNYIFAGSMPANNTIPFLATLDVFSYAGSTFKTALVTSSTDANGSGSTRRLVSLWRSTSAITSIKLISNGGTYTAGTTATLYGIL